MSVRPGQHQRACVPACLGGTLLARGHCCGPSQKGPGSSKPPPPHTFTRTCGCLRIATVGVQLGCGGRLWMRPNQEAAQERIWVRGPVRSPPCVAGPCTGARAGLDAYSAEPVYCATKWGLRGYSHSIYQVRDLSLPFTSAHSATCLQVEPLAPGHQSLPGRGPSPPCNQAPVLHIPTSDPPKHKNFTSPCLWVGGGEEGEAVTLLRRAPCVAPCSLHCSGPQHRGHELQGRGSAKEGGARACGPWARCCGEGRGVGGCAWGGGRGGALVVMQG
jgi:hypothetical protein